MSAHNRGVSLNLKIAATTAAIMVVTIIAGLAFGGDPMQVDLESRLADPSTKHPLGTDHFGRDLLTRIAVGGLVSGQIALLVVIIATVFGTTAGLLAGFIRGWTDRIIMSLTEAMISFPAILLALALVAVLGTSRWGIVGALSVAYIPIVVRVVRGATLSLREADYVAAARLAGGSAIYIMSRHILPNLLAPLLVIMTTMFGWVLLSESALSFLGIGVPPPTPTWGNMLSEARPFLGSAPRFAIAPGLAITLTLISFNLFGDVLRDRLDPRSRGR